MGTHHTLLPPIMKEILGRIQFLGQPLESDLSAAFYPQDLMILCMLLCCAPFFFFLIDSFCFQKITCTFSLGFPNGSFSWLSRWIDPCHSKIRFPSQDCLSPRAENHIPINASRPQDGWSVGSSFMLTPGGRRLLQMERGMLWLDLYVRKNTPP